MASKGQLRGALLEEVILILLRGSGYVPVVSVGQDPTLKTCSAGLQVRGRGADHQIDAIADFSVSQPFTNPQRLLVEAKAYDVGRNIGLDVVRNAIGVLKDVSEFWRVDAQSPKGRTRYSYRAAVFSTSGFSSPAQEYAYAQDVHLLPLARSAHFKPVLAALWDVSDALADDPTDASIKDLRRQFRRAMSGMGRNVDAMLQPLLTECAAFRTALLGMIANRFPVFLIPERLEALEELPERTEIRIHFDADGWYLGPVGDERLFTFDLPDELLELYAESGQLSREAAANMKGDLFQTITAFHVQNGRPRIITMELDGGWLQRLKERIQTERKEANRNQEDA